MFAIVKTAIRNAKREPRPVTAIDRSSEIMRAMRQEADRENSLHGLAYVACVAGLLAVAAYGGFNLPEPQGGTYDAIQISADGAESDIVDYDLSWSDCAAYARASALIACELASK